MDHDEFARRAEALRARLYRAAYLYIGLPENDLTVYPRGTLFECCGEIMTLTHTEVTRINDRDEYVWAIFNYYGKKESEGGEDAQNA